MMDGADARRRALASSAPLRYATVLGAHSPSLARSDERDEELRTLFDNDYTDSEIADYFGIDNVERVKVRRLKLGLERRPACRRLTVDERCKLTEMTHLTNAQAAAALGRHPTTVHRVRKQMGLRHDYKRRAS